MNKVIERITTFALFAALAHCGGPVLIASDSGHPHDNDAGEGGTSSGTLALTASSAQYATNIGSIAPRAGDRFLIVNLSLENDSVPSPVGGDPLFFTVTLASHLVVDVAGNSAELPMMCRPDVSAAAGGTLTCAVAFELSTSDTPVTLNYDDHQGHTASATIPAPAMAVNPIVGTWVDATMSSGLPATRTFVFNDDGTATYSIDSSMVCSGRIEYDGYLWTATETQIDLSGTPVCSGSLVCSGGSVSCSLTGNGPSGTCRYQFNDSNTLMLSCTGASGTFTRM